MTVSPLIARRLLAGAGLLLIGLGVNVAVSVDRPLFVLLILSLIGGGLLLAAAGVVGVSGYSVVAHAKAEARAIEKVHGRKELTR